MERTKDLNRIMQLLNNRLAKIEHKSMEGLVRSAVLIHKETETTYPVTPRDLGNLRASWFIVTGLRMGGGGMGGGGIFKNRPGREGRQANLAGKMGSDHAIALSAAKAATRDARFFARETKEFLLLYMGYSAFYASKVHEMVDANFKFEGSGAKWFERAIKRNVRQIEVICATYAKKP